MASSSREWKWRRESLAAVDARVQRDGPTGIGTDQALHGLDEPIFSDRDLGPS
jgi:hypothetical protein